MSLLCPTEEDYAMLRLSATVNFACVGGKGEKGGNGDWARGLKIGQLTLGMGPARVEVCLFVQRATIPSMKVVFVHS